MRRPVASIGSLGVRCVVNLIQLYRHTISPLRLPSCRFTPTCSQYAVEALSEYGLVRGGWLAVVRLLKCGPWHKGGWDPIPERPVDAHESGARAGEADRGSADVVGDDPAQRSGSETRV